MDRKRPSILSRLRSDAARAGKRAQAGAAGESFAFAAEIPGDDRGRPLMRLAVEMQSQPQGAGERLRLRLHWQANFASALALAPPTAASETPLPPARVPAQRVAEKIGGWLRAGLARPLVQRLAAPLLRHDFNSWMELRASSADLDDAAEALLPERERLLALGVQLPEGDGPLAQTWTGATSGSHPGFAQLSLLRLDKRHLPPRLAQLLGSKPLQLAAALVNVIEERREIRK